MGIDVTVLWDGMSAEDRKKQFKGALQTGHGNVGYLHEAYHGRPYATKALAGEAFDVTGTCHCEPLDFTMLRTLDEYAEQVAARDPCSVCRGATIRAEILRARLHVAKEAVRIRYEKLYDADEEEIVAEQDSYEAFVSLVERLEAEGKNPTIHASW